MSITIQAAADRLPPSDCAPAASGSVRASAATLLMPLLEKRLVFCMGMDGGHDDDDGNHWVWQSAAALAKWLEDFHNIQVSGDTVARSLERLVASGRWIRARLGKRWGQRTYYYRPTAPIPQPAELNQQQTGIDSAMARNHTETTSGQTTTDPGRCAFSEPVDPGSESHLTGREKPVKRRDRPDPTRYQSQGGIPFEAPDWAREHVQSTYALLQPQEAQEQPVTDESPTKPVEDCSRLDSGPSQAPGQSEAGIVTDESCAAACDAFNKAMGRGWTWDAARQQFLHRILPMRRSLAEMARSLAVSPATLRLLVEGGA